MCALYKFYTTILIINGMPRVRSTLNPTVKRTEANVYMEHFITLVFVFSEDLDILIHFKLRRINSIHGMMLSIEKIGIISPMTINTITHFGALFMISTPS